jgi:hypothetical protein
VRPGSEAATIHAEDRKSNARNRVRCDISGHVARQRAHCNSIAASVRAFGLAALALALSPGTLRAYEDQLTLGVQLGYAHATESRSAHSGALVGVTASLGLDDIWSVRALLSYSWHPGTPSLSVGLLGGELLYLVDILEIVPYFGAGIDALGSWTGDRGLSAELGVHPVLGLDWLPSRGFSLGVEARPVFLVTSWSRQPIYLSAGITAALLFDL